MLDTAQSRQTKTKAILKGLTFLPPLCIMCLIFYFSGQDSQASSSVSYPVTHKFVLFWDRVLSLDLSLEQKIYYTAVYHATVRKLAHVTLYLMLSVSLYIPFRAFRLARPRLWVVAVCMLYAVSDEIHQLFSLGRYATPVDVLIDTAGACLGLLLAELAVLACSSICTLYAQARQVN